MYCPYCGEALQEAAAFCVACGKRIPALNGGTAAQGRGAAGAAPPKTRSKKKRILLLGILGVVLALGLILALSQQHGVHLRYAWGTSLDEIEEKEQVLSKGRDSFDSSLYLYCDDPGHKADRLKELPFGKTNGTEVRYQSNAEGALYRISYETDKTLRTSQVIAILVKHYGSNYVTEDGYSDEMTCYYWWLGDTVVEYIGWDDVLQYYDASYVERERKSIVWLFEEKGKR